MVAGVRGPGAEGAHRRGAPERLRRAARGGSRGGGAGPLRRGPGRAVPRGRLPGRCGAQPARPDAESRRRGQTKWTAKVGFQWELDIFGRIRRQTEAARARYLATEEGRRGVLLSLVSDVAIAYFELRELDTELAIAQRTTAAFQDTYDLFTAPPRGRRRIRPGDLAGRSVCWGRWRPRSRRSSGPSSPRRTRSISCSAGRRSPSPARAVTRPRPARSASRLALGAPGAAARRAPGGRAAVAANAGVGAAKARFFPTLSLTGTVRERRARSSLTSSPTARPGASPRACWARSSPAGQIKKNYEAARARFEQGKVLYEAAVTNAFRRGVRRPRGPLEARGDRAAARAGGDGRL